MFSLLVNVCIFELFVALCDKLFFAIFKYLNMRSWLCIAAAGACEAINFMLLLHIYTFSPSMFIIIRTADYGWQVFIM